MTLSEQIFRDFDLQANCVAVADRSRGRLYLAQFSLALEVLVRILAEGSGTANSEVRAVSAAVQRLRETYRLLGLKHFFTEGGEELAIDTTDSGFFHFSTLLGLGADLEGKERELKGLPGVQALKASMVERMVKYREHPRFLQEQLARRLYLEALGPGTYVAPFESGEVVDCTGHGETPAWLWSFSTFDKALNRPFVYLIYFAAGRRPRPPSRGSPVLQALEEAAARLASGRTSLLAFSHTLDDEVPDLAPRIVKRFIIGPWCSPLFTANEGDLGRLLESLKDRSPFLLQWETETLLSDRETVVDAGLLSRGRLKQIFWIPREAEAIERGASRVERFLLCPHWVGQELEAAGLMASHHRWTFDQGARIYGSD